jgi:hypothetical protein
MVRLVQSVARCALTGMQHATNGAAVQPAPQQAAQQPNPLRRESEGGAVQLPAQQPRNCCATSGRVLNPNGLRELRDLVHRPDQQLEALAVALIPHRWTEHFADREPLELVLTEPVSHSSIRERYPTAVAAEPFSRPFRAATADEASELRKIISTVLPDDVVGQREALAVAMTDIDAALTCFRVLVVAAKPNTSCSTCQHRRHPGTAEGCVERHDLEPLFGLLRRLPEDRGAACTSWRGI